MPQTRNPAETAGRSQGTVEEDERGTEQTTKECLKEISSKLSTVIFTLNTLNENFVEVKEQLSTRGVPSPDANFGTIEGTLEKLNDVLDGFKLPEYGPTTNQRPNTAIHIEENALRIKNKLSQIWNNNLQARKSLYWQALRNKNLATTFEEWLHEDIIVLPQWVQMKDIPNEPTNVTKRREKQTMDNFLAEKELLLLRSESQESKYKDLDLKMITEIEKQATRQSRNLLLNMWQEDCKQNEEISKKRWQNSNQTWLNNYKEKFKVNYQNKNHFIKIADEKERNKTYAAAVTTPPPTNNKRQIIPGYQKRNTFITQEQRRGQSEETQRNPSQDEAPVENVPLPQRPQRNQRKTRLDETQRRQSSPRETQEIPGATSSVPIFIDFDAETGNNTQIDFLGLGPGRG